MEIFKGLEIIDLQFSLNQQSGFVSDIIDVLVSEIGNSIRFSNIYECH